MKKLLSLCLCLCLLAPAALADVIVEPEDAFWAAHRDECEYLYRAYQANGPEGYVTLWESPLSSNQTENVPNGEYLHGDWQYTDGEGRLWRMAADSRGVSRGWVKAAECTVVPDYLTFAEEHESEFVPYDSSYDHAFDDLETVVLWKYPGSGIVEYDQCDARWFRENTTPAEAFQDCWVDGQGRFWGFSNYVLGWRNVWVCLSDPAGLDLEADEAVVAPSPTPIPPAEVVPEPTRGVSPLAMALVAAVVCVTAVLIPLVCRKKKERP